MKLISMTDFVLSDKIKTQLEMIRYAKFVKQRCNKEMFIGDKALFMNCEIKGDCLFVENEFFEYLNDIDNYTIEDLLWLDLTLTQYAIKELGL